MSHVRSITRKPAAAQQDGNITPIEQGILTVLTLFFSGWDNFQPVIQSLTRFYAKTPSEF